MTDKPTDLIVQDVRCFEGEQRGLLRPITLLVGENSSGKTTFLGCYATLHRMFSRRSISTESPDFNEEPFVMGSFRDIVRSRRGPSGLIKEFKLGFAVEGRIYDRLTVTFREEGSQPIVSRLRFDLDSGSFMEMWPNDSGDTVFEAPTLDIQETDFPFNDAPFVLPATFMDRKQRRWALRTFEGLREVARHLSLEYFDPPSLPALIPIAPLRSKPERTYNPVREIASAEGEHVPMLMMRLDRTDKRHWVSLHRELVAFGHDAGLFSDIKVKRHGKQMSDPFQLQVKVRSGPHANIVDVGYGVSQSLPILVDIMAANGSARQRRHTEGRTFLLQQPEVHLHPRGQAELASLFVKAYIKRGNHFLIETHSDYIVDRVRISVQQGLLPPEDVSILYFEPTGNAVKIHDMHLDRNGNLLGAPAGYREFFLKETDRLLGFAD